MDPRILEIIYDSLNRLEELPSQTVIEVQSKVFFSIQKINNNTFSIKSDSDLDTTFSTIEELSDIIKDTGIIRSVEYHDYSRRNRPVILWVLPSSRLDEAIEETGILREPLTSDMLEDCGICSMPLNVGFMCKINNEECNHYFHCRCLNDWFQKGKSSCPICRRYPTRTKKLKHVKPFKFGSKRGELSYLKRFI